jgi:hypothetical protein
LRARMTGFDIISIKEEKRPLKWQNERWMWCPVDDHLYTSDLWKSLKRINVIAVQSERLHNTHLPNWNGLPQLLLTHSYKTPHREHDENMSYEPESANLTLL